MIVVVPAYGRKYTRPLDVRADWEANLDFITQHEATTYINRSSFLEYGAYGVDSVMYIHDGVSLVLEDGIF